MRAENRRKNLPPEEARNWLFSLLTRRSCARREAFDRLRERGVSEEDAESLLDEAQEMALLDDEAYARLFAEGHASWGGDRIAYELRRREVLDEYIQAALEDIDEEERARAVAAPWLKSGVEIRKIIGRLRRRGFSGAAASAACDM